MKCTWQEFTEKLRIYRKNRENVPLQELKTKYAKGYNKLISDLYQMAAEVLRDVICSGMYTMTCDTAERKDLADRINQIIDSEKEAGIGKELRQAMFKEYDPEKFLGIAVEKLRMPAWYQAYAPYWVSKCKKGQDGRIRCDLLPEFCWDESCQVWIREDNGTWEFTSMLPPTLEMVRKEQEDMKCHRT